MTLFTVIKCSVFQITRKFKKKKLLLVKKKKKSYFLSWRYCSGNNFQSNLFILARYYVNGRIATVDDFTNSEILDSLQDELRTGNRIIEATGRKRKLWLGETSSAYGGGADGLSDAYVAAFMYVWNYLPSKYKTIDKCMQLDTYMTAFVHVHMLMPFILNDVQMWYTCTRIK